MRLEKHFFFVALALVAQAAYAQCTMTTQVVSVEISPFGWPNCPASGGPTHTYSINTTGGTGPFHIVVEAYFSSFAQWMTPANVTGDADGDLTGQFQAWFCPQVRATVTDAMNCTATNALTIPLASARQLAFVQAFPDPCTGMAAFSFLDQVVFADECFPPGSTLSVDGVDTGPEGVGFVAIGPHTFKTTAEYPPGAHSIIINPTYDYCGSYQTGWCPGSITLPAVTSGDCGVNVSLRAALQGALPSGTVMTDALRSANLIPTTEPYSTLGYTYVGSAPGATIPAAMLSVTGNDAIEDWVVVELRNAMTPSQVACSKAVLIQRDGDVIDRDGDTWVNLSVAAGNYYVALRHRNHLGVMTASAQALGALPVSIDLRSGATACYGTSPRALVGSTYCLWAADATGNGSLKYTGSGNDRDPIILAIGGTTPNNVVSNVYDRRDTNLDGVIKYTGTGNDRDVILTNVGSTTPNNSRTQQLP